MQSKKKVNIKSTKQFHVLVEFENLLRTILVRPQLWLEQRFQYLRNFVLTVSRGKDRNKFRIVEGDEALTVAGEEQPSTTGGDTIAAAGEEEPSTTGDEAQSVAKGEDPSTTITKNFIQTLAEGGNIPDGTEPVLFVLMRKTGFHNHTAHQDCKTQKVKLTQLTLVDGDNNTIHARMATHLADVGRQLVEGDIIKLGLYTPLRFM